MMNDLPYDGWPECWQEYGAQPGSADPVTVRVGIYEPSGDPDAGSIALCTSGGRPILLDEQAARGLAELLNRSIESYRADTRRQREWRHATARNFVDAAVLSRDQFNQVMAAVQDGGNVAAVRDILTACAPTSWHSGTRAQPSSEL